MEDFDIVFELGSPEQYTEYTRALAAPIVAMIAPHPEDVQKATWDAITEAAREAADDDGEVRLTNQVLVAAGQA